MKALRHVTPALRVYCGGDSLKQLAGELAREGIRRAAIFCGRSVAAHPDGLRLVAEALGERCAGAFEGVKSHSPLDAVLAGADSLRALGADAVVAVGGGSAVVTARAASILLAEGRSIAELCTRFEPGKAPVSPRLEAPKLPQFVVPTTPTTAYAKAGSAVLDESIGQRRALFDPKTRAGVICIHPGTASTAPAALVTTAAVSAFSLAVQGLESRSRDPLADALLLHALRMLASGLRKLAVAPDDAQTRADLMLGALLAGQGTDYAPAGLASALAHSMGARLHTDNGVVNAILLPHTMRFNAPVTGERLALVADALDAPDRGSRQDAAIEATAELFAAASLPSRLRDVGVAEASLQQVAGDAAADWFLLQNPRPVSGTAGLLEVLRAAW